MKLSTTLNILLIAIAVALTFSATTPTTVAAREACWKGRYFDVRGPWYDQHYFVAFQVDPHPNTYAQSWYIKPPSYWPLPTTLWANPDDNGVALAGIKGFYYLAKTLNPKPQDWQICSR